MNAIPALRRAAVGHADLLRGMALAGEDKSRELHFALQLGFEAKAEIPQAPRRTLEIQTKPRSAASEQEAVEIDRAPAPRALSAPIMAVTSCELIQHKEDRPPVSATVRPLTEADCRPLKSDQPPFIPLVRLPLLWPAVQNSLVIERKGRIDVRGLVARLAVARPPASLPLESRTHWSGELLVIWDRGQRMAPYEQDYVTLLKRLVYFRGETGLIVCVVNERPEQREATWCFGGTGNADLSGSRIPKPRSGATVLLLSDLGALHQNPSSANSWQRFIKHINQSATRVVAWTPQSARQVDVETARLVRLYCLDPASRLQAQRGHLRTPEQRVAEHDRLALLREMLLTLVSFCVRLEPQLLRALRKLDSKTAAEPGLEGMLWAHRPIVRSSDISRPIAANHQLAYRKQFEKLSPTVQRLALARAMYMHAWQGRSTGMQEALIWDSHVSDRARGKVEEEWIKAAREWFAGFVESQPPEAPSREAAEFADDVLIRNWGDEIFQHRYSEWLSILLDMSGREAIPAGLSGHVLGRTKGRKDRKRGYTLLQVGSQVVVWPSSMEVPVGPISRLSAPLMLRGLEVNRTSPPARRWVVPRGRPTMLWSLSDQQPSGSMIIDGHRHDITKVSRPEWAREFGRDSLGLYADLVVESGYGSVTQCMRYIPAGTVTFDRKSSRKPISKVGPDRATIERGFWLPAGPSKAALWAAVCGRLDGDYVDMKRLQFFVSELRKWIVRDEIALPSDRQIEYLHVSDLVTAFKLSTDSHDLRSGFYFCVNPATANRQ
jgi:hypothetical protein